MSSAGPVERGLLIDASVWLASLDRDVRHHDAAGQLLESAAAGSRTLACPATLERADDSLLRAAAATAERHRLTVYDRAYAELRIVAAGRS